MSGLTAISATAPATAPAAPASSSALRALTPQQRAAVAQLAATDRHVRAHEQAHLAAAGPYATSGPSYSYATGPDGNLYAIGGEVSLDVSPDPSNPQRTIEKARRIEAAANAPVDPSSQDRMVAAQAALMAAAAERELSAAARQVCDAYQPVSVNPGQLLSWNA